jgi:WD40 repeat protein
MKFNLVLRACLLVCALFADALRAQTPTPSPHCQPPAPLVAPAGANIFTPQQEMDLGDAIAEQLQRDFRIVGDTELTAHLQRIGERIVEQMPHAGLRFRFFLFDLPDANAFTLPGGRIYVSRKLIALTRSEDELAGVIAHELGHAVTRQPATGMTRILREVLGVTRVSDRRDIFEKYNELVDNTARKPKAFNRGDSHEQKEQIIADQIGLYALSAAGYDPQALSTFWDRYAETKGKTSGGFLSDLFGTTKPEVVRLREMLKLLGTLPAECITKGGRADAAEFQKWQAAVINYSGLGVKESLRGVLSKTVLEPPLRGEVTHLKFSPDGKYLIAQDDSGISVLSREPFASLFRIDAPEALPAQFSPDSQLVSFSTPSLRVETWSVAERKQRSVKEMFVRDGCLQTALSADGRALACVEGDFALTLFEVGTGAQLLQKKSFYKPDFFDIFRLQLRALLGDEFSGDLAFDFVSMAFSPDARYFVAGQRNSAWTMAGIYATEVNAVGFDLSTNTNVPLKGLLKKLVSGQFTFLTPDRLLGVNPEDFRKSALVNFPSGEVVEQFPLQGNLTAVTRGNYVTIHPLSKYRTGLFDLATKRGVIGFNKDALDVYDNVFASEQMNGELGLYTVDKNEQVGKLLLPRNDLGILRALAVSSDLKWLAVSERSRGAVWDLTKGERKFHVHGFRGAHFADDGSLYADAAKNGNSERNVKRLVLATGAAFDGIRTQETGDYWASQQGPYVLSMKAGEKGSARRVFTVRDARTGAQLWSQNFEAEAPSVWANPYEGTLVFGWSVSTAAAKDEIKNDPALKQRAAQLREKEGDYLLQVLDARRGVVLSKLLIETGKGSFRIRSVVAVGESVVIADTQNRVLVYALATGEQRGKVFGSRPAVAKATGLLSVENERGQLTLYDLKTMSKRDSLVFASPVSFARFSDDGRRLFVLTANQTAYLLNLFEKEN